MLENIEVLCHSSIRINKEKVIYIDPFKINKNYNDADIIFITHDHYDHYSEEGYNVLIPYMRATGESEGEYIGMGWLDKDDLQCWINKIIEQNNNANIVLHGSSMGAATVLMASGDDLPSNVKAIIEDSGYTSVWDIFASEAKVRFGLPEFPVLNMFEIVANFRAKYDIKKSICT